VSYGFVHQFQLDESLDESVRANENRVGVILRWPGHCPLTDKPERLGVIRADED
jgi:hypothetical protein